MHIVTQIVGRVTALYSQVLAFLKELLYLLVSNLHVRFILAFQSVGNLQLLSHLVQLKLSIKAWLAQFTNQALLIKVGLMNALHKAGDLGQQLLTTARQILQRVKQTLKQGN